MSKIKYQKLEMDLFNCKNFKNISYFAAAFLIFNFLFLISVNETNAGDTTLYLAPSKGTFYVGGTFSVSVLVDTKEQEINVVEVNLEFPADILQVAAPTSGQSFISEWIVPPSYSNAAGKISYLGGIPGGITTSAGLISNITFRAKSPGIARIKISDSSRVLLNDGKGTPVSTINLGGIYEILISPPEGPKITSSTHPDPGVWYSNSSPIFSWEKEEGTSDFSFILSQNSQENPDNVSEGSETFKSYEGVSDGIWYFHLRAKKDGGWGRTSHAAVKIDTAPPEKFEPRIETYSKFLYFETKDFHSGMDHYEVSSVPVEKTSSQSPFFIESVSPYKLPSNSPGRYSAIVRAYDKAGNYSQAKIDFRIVSPFLSYIEGKGVQIRGFLFPWWLIYSLFALLFFLLILFAFRLVRSKMGFKKGIKEIGEALSEIEKIERRERESRRLKEKFLEEKEKLEKRFYRETEKETLEKKIEDDYKNP